MPCFKSIADGMAIVSVQEPVICNTHELGALVRRSRRNDLLSGNKELYTDDKSRLEDTALWYRNSNGEYNDFKAAHAGLVKAEMLVPLIVIEK